MKIRSVGAGLFHAGGRTDKYGESTSHFSQVFERAQNATSITPSFTEVLLITTFFTDFKHPAEIKAQSDSYILVRHCVTETPVIKLSFITFMQGIYNYIPETSHAAVLYVLVFQLCCNYILWNM